MPKRREELDRKDEVFGPYEEYLSVPMWPRDVGTATSEPDFIAVADMAPQHAAAAICKLVRWARYAPKGDTVLAGPDQESREEHVRVSTLGEALAARAVGMTPEHFYAVYGAHGPGVMPDMNQLLGYVMQALGDSEHGLPEWDLPTRASLAGVVLSTLFSAGYRVTEEQA